MTAPSRKALNALWSRHNAEWRDTAQIASQWREAANTDAQLLVHKVRGAWWQALAESGVTLLVTREYEHLIMALSVRDNRPVVTYMPMPHPSGVVVDRRRGLVHIASTRNPNQIYDLAAVTDAIGRLDVKHQATKDCPLVPVRSRFLPGCLYMHDLALVEGSLHANAVGLNAVVRLYNDGHYEPVWWPRCIEKAGEPVFGQNHIQLNSIAAGSNLKGSYFTASTDRISARRPGHQKFSVDKRGVIFSGATREPMAWGLTRPHSARLHNRQIWVGNSGYGELGYIDKGRFTPVAKLPGWTRGMCLIGRIAFVGTSRVIPRFRQYAPGLDADKSECGVHAVDLASGHVAGSLIWPSGNQIFALDWVSRQLTSGFPFSVSRRASAREKKVFYTFKTNAHHR